MTLITKPDFTYVWASGGAVVAPNDAKKQLGWVAEAPPFQYDNWLQNRQDQMLAHINQRGVAAWDALTNYEAGGLSYVQGSDGKVYKSVAASGPSATVQNPTTDGTDTYWTIAFADTLLSNLANTSTARINLDVYSKGELLPVFSLNQTYQDVTGSRAFNTTYTNSTSKPILVQVRGLAAASGTFLISAKANGVTVNDEVFVNRPTALDGVAMQFVVLPGLTYRVDATDISMTAWKEYR